MIIIFKYIFQQIFFPFLAKICNKSAPECIFKFIPSISTFALSTRVTLHFLAYWHTNETVSGSPNIIIIHTKSKF